MDNHHPKNEDHVEYVEAEPIEPEGKPPPQTTSYRAAPFPGQVYYNSNATCVPCCGPVGCLSFILLFLLIFTDMNVQPLILALSIFIIISFVARLAAPRRF